MFPLLINILESLMMTWFYTHCLNPRNKRVYSLSLFIVIMTIMTISNYISLYDLLLTTFLIFVVFMISQAFCQKNIWEILFLIIFEELILCVSATVYILLIPFYHPYLCIIIQKIVYGLILVGFTVFYHKHLIEIDSRSYILLSLICFISHFIYQLLIQVYIHRNMQDIEILLIIILYILFVLGILLMVFHISTQEQERRKIETMMNEMKISQNNHQHLMKLYKEMKREKHDMKHKYLLMNQYLQHKQYENLSLFLQNEMKQTELFPTFVLSQNEHLNTIINAKIIVAYASHLTVSTTIHVLKDIPLQDYHIHALLGNLLDNAIEHNCQDGSIQIKIIQEQSSLFIEIVNTFVHDVQKSFLTTKGDQSNHGYGLKTVQDIVYHYHGNIDIKTYQDDRKYFLVSIGFIFESTSNCP